MPARVGIVGVGYEGFRPLVADLSTRELMYQAASKAYADAGVDPRTEVGSFICCTEDLWEGWSITDEMVPDQVGGARRPLCTVPGDGITGMGHAVMHIRSGVADVVSIEAHSKVADVLDKTAVENLALDPQFHRVPGVNFDLLAGLEMSAFMRAARLDRDDISLAVMSEKAKALRNERASYGANLDLETIGQAEPVSEPLRAYDKSEFAEAGVVVVLASERWIKRKGREAVFIDGISWRSSTPWFEGGSPRVAKYAQEAYKSVAKQAGVTDVSYFDLLEVDDTYSYKLIQHLMSLGATRSDALSMLERDGRSLNPSGGSLGTGYLIEANGLHKVLECVLQLRGTAGGNQVKDPRTALAVSWRGNPTCTGAAVALRAVN